MGKFRAESWADPASSPTAPQGRPLRARDLAGAGGPEGERTRDLAGAGGPERGRTRYLAGAGGPEGGRTRDIAGAGGPEGDLKVWYPEVSGRWPRKVSGRWPERGVAAFWNWRC